MDRGAIVLGIFYLVCCLGGFYLGLEGLSL
jgi:hypothetical protein